jgi:hypothetical protein
MLPRTVAETFVAADFNMSGPLTVRTSDETSPNRAPSS